METEKQTFSQTHSVSQTPTEMKLATKSQLKTYDDTGIKRFFANNKIIH